MKLKKILPYLIILIFDIQCVLYEYSYGCESISMAYGKLRVYTIQAFIYVPLFYYMLMNRIVFFTNAMTITRLRCKKDILIFQSYENLMQAIEMSVVTNLFAAAGSCILMRENLKINELIYVIFCNLLAQIFAWIFLGYLYILIINLIDKAALSVVIGTLFSIFLFWAHSGTFIFRKWFIDPHELMVIDIDNTTYQGIMMIIMKSIICGLVLCAVSYIGIMKKQIFGIGEKNENDR